MWGAGVTSVFLRNVLIGGVLLWKTRIIRLRLQFFSPCSVGIHVSPSLGDRQRIAQKRVRAIDARDSQLEVAQVLQKGQKVPQSPKPRKKPESDEKVTKK